MNCRTTMGRFFRLATAILSSLVLAAGLRAQDNPIPASAPAPVASSNRFLFVLDVSAPMRKHSEEVVKVVRSILSTGASGQLHTGDTIGVWTFNDDVYTGIMPLETWSPDDSDEICMRITEFIRQQDYEKKSRLDMVMAPIGKVIKISDILTVFIVSSGAGPIRGTPYDDDINAQYQACLHDMGKKTMPIVTVLQGKDGRFIRYTVNALPWPVVIPEMPIRVKVPNAEPAAPVQVLASAPPVAPTPTNVAVAANSAPQPVQPPAAAPAPASPPVVVAPPVIVPPTDVRAPASAAETGPPPNIPSQFMPQPAQAVKPASAPPPAVVVPPPAPAPVPVAQPVVAQTASAASTPAPEPVVKPATSDQLPIVPVRQPPLVPKTLPADAVMAEHAAPAAPATPPRPSQATVAPQTASAPPAPAPPKTLVAQATALIKSFTSEHRGLLLIGGIGLLVVASTLIVFMARGSRPHGRVSLISQTMQQPRR